MPMRHSFLLRHLFPILLANSLVLSTHALRAQKSLPLEENHARIFDRPIPLVSVPEATDDLGPARGALPEAPRSQTELSVELFSYDHTLINPRAVLNLQQPTGTAVLPGKGKYFTFSASTQWPTLDNSSIPFPIIHPADYFQYYGRHIPWVGSIIPRVSQKAEAHPHVTGVLKLLKFRF